MTVTTVKRSRWERTTNQPGTVIAADSVDVYARSLRLPEQTQGRHRLPREKGRRPGRDLRSRARGRGRKGPGGGRTRPGPACKKAEAAMRVSRAAIDVGAGQGPGRQTRHWMSPRPRYKIQKRQLDRFRERDLAKSGTAGQEAIDEAADRYASSPGRHGYGSLSTGSCRGHIGRDASEARGGQGRRGRGHERSPHRRVRSAQRGNRSRGTQGSLLPSTVS